MKQLTALLLIPIYLMLHWGVQVNKHYCMGELASVSVFVGAEACACGDETPMGCCTDEHQTFQVDDEQQLGFDVQGLKTKSLNFLPQLFHFQLFTLQSNTFHYLPTPQVFDYKPPLNPPTTPLYLRHQVLRI